MPKSRVSSFAQRATDVGQHTVTALQDVAQRAGTQAADIGDRVVEEGRRTQRSLGRRVEERPLTTILIAAAFGGVLARLLHRR